jgi:hypothetical protein
VYVASTDDVMCCLELATLCRRIVLYSSLATIGTKSALPALEHGQENSRGAGMASSPDYRPAGEPLNLTA